MTTDDTNPFATFDEDLVAGLSTDPEHDPVGSSSVVQDTLNPDGEAESTTSPGERRPGGPGSSSSPQGGPQGEPKRGLFDRLKRKDKAAAEDTPKPPKRTKQAGARVGRRASAADTLADVWSGVGSLAIRSGQHAPLGRCLQFQAPVAGEMLDEAVKGSFIDKLVLQPVVKGRGRFDLLGAVLGPPLIVLAIERNPEQIDALMPMLRSSVRASLPLMVPAIKKVQEKERRAAEAAAELFPDLAPGEDPVDGIIAMMFADWTPQAREPEPQDTQTESVQL